MESPIFVFITVMLLNSLCYGSIDNESRNLTYYLNPGCQEELDSRCDGITFLHIKAEAENDTMHYIWDFTGSPSLALARTDNNVSLFIDWDKFLAGETFSLNFSSTPSFISFLVINKILLFNDPDDKANVNDESIKDTIPFDPHKFSWNRINITENNNHITLHMNSSVDNKGTNRSFAIKLSVSGSSGHGEELPHLYHTAHSSQVDLIVNNINSPNYTSPRVAVEFLFVTFENKSEGDFKLHKRRNLDDEFTPGIFDVFDIVSPQSVDGKNGAFFQYRPVCYTTKWRTVSDSTELKQGNIISYNNNEQEIEKFIYTLPYSYYGYTLGSKIAQGTNITFGMAGDGFYSKSNYTSFSLLMGMGAPPVEKLSVFVITFAAIGLGIPLLVLLIGGVSVAIRRYRD